MNTKKIHGFMIGTVKYHGWMKNRGWKMGPGRSILKILVMYASCFILKVDMSSGPLVNGEKKDITRAGTINDETIQANQELFDEREPKGDNDDDIKDLDDYLVPDDAPFIVNKEDE
ncbi:hypothetical protein Tco_0111306 [Tanacetum coccineum]